MIHAGRIDEVARYCESDVLNTYRVWLVYELFRGSINLTELNWSETQVRAFIAARKLTNPHLCEAVGIPNINQVEVRLQSSRSPTSSVWS